MVNSLFRTKRNFGWVKDRYDERDHLHQVRKKLPDRVLLSPVPAGDQGQEGCYSDDTEVLTGEGWKSFSDVGFEDSIATRTPSGQVEYHQPTARTDYHYSGDMVHVSKRGLDFLVTPNHNIYARKWNERTRTLGDPIFSRADQLGWYMGLYRTGEWAGKDREFFEIEKRVTISKDHPTEIFKIPMDDWLWFLGIYIAEGCVYANSGDYRIEIAAVNPKKRPTIEDHLAKLPWKFTVYPDRFTCHNKCLYEYLKPLGQAKEKHVPQFVKALPSHRIEQFLDGYTLGDGCQLQGRTWFYTASSRLADDLQELLLKMDKVSNIREHYCEGSVIKGRAIEPSLSYVLEVKKRQQACLERDDLSLEHYDGHVHCLEVPNHTLFVRRHGTPVWLGNSCVGWGVGGSLTALAGDKILEWFSPRDVYNGAKFIGGYLDSEGAFPSDAYKWVIRKTGGCLPWSFWPYEANVDSFKAPSLSLDPERAKHPVLHYYRVASGINGIMSALASKHFVSLGCPWFSKWMSTDKNGVLKRVSAKDPLAGGHETYLFGYDRTLQLAFGMNSWSPSWSPLEIDGVSYPGGYAMRFDSFDVMKAVQGYDAHHVTVNWKREVK